MSEARSEVARVRVIAAGARHWRREELRPRRVLEDWHRSRGLALRLMARNLRAQYRQTLLGYSWALIPPLATTLLWVFLQSQKIIAVDTRGVPYPVFVLTGLLLWGLFMDSLQAPLHSATEARAMLARVRFPWEALLVAGFGEVLFHFAIRLLPWFAVLLWFDFLPVATWPLALLGLLALIILGTAIGVLLTPFGLLYHDVGRGIGIFGQFWFYLTPIIYPPIEDGVGKWIAVANPVSPLVVMTRHWLLGDSSAPWVPFLGVIFAALLLLVVAIAVFRFSMPIVIERMSS